MKRLFICLAFFISATANAQADATTPPYLRFPTVPSFKLLMGDSTRFFTKDALPKNKALLLMVFSPDCSHCQHTAEEIIQHKDDLKNYEIVMATMHTVSQMNAFAENYGLNALPNVVLGKDVAYLLPSFFGIHNLPYMAFYRKDGTLIRGMEGALPIDRVVQLFKDAGQ